MAMVCQMFSLYGKGINHRSHGKLAGVLVGTEERL